MFDYIIQETTYIFNHVTQLYKKFTHFELCVIVTNLNRMSTEHCHVKTTPNMPVRVAVKMSISIPGIGAS